MRLPQMPDQMIGGGGELINQRSGTLDSGRDDLGDRWWSRLGAGTATVILDTDLDLEIRVFQRGEPIPEARIQRSSTSLSFTVDAPDYYTFLVTLSPDALINFATQDGSTVQGDYEITLEATIAETLPLPDTTDRLPSAEVAIVSEPTQATIALDEGNGWVGITAFNNVTARVLPGAVTNASASGNFQLRGATGRQPLIVEPANLRGFALLDGNLTLQLAVPAGERAIFIEGYSLGVGGLSLLNAQFNQIPTFGDNRRVGGNIEWEQIERVYLLPNCLGISFADAVRTLIVEGRDFDIGTVAAGSAGSIGVVSDRSAYDIAVADWGSEAAPIQCIFASGGFVNIYLDDCQLSRTDPQDIPTRSLSLNRPAIRITSGETLFTIDDPDSASPRLIETDWANLRRIALNRAEAGGEMLELQVRDAPIREGQSEIEARGIIRRTSAAPLDQLESRAEEANIASATFEMIWEDRSRNLLLPEAEDFIEIITPAEAELYDANARPGEVGFQPANRNNAGRDCFVVNTEFDFNCAPNGMVNPANGNLSFSVVDLHARGRDLDLILTRTYNSHNAHMDGPFGFGWSSDYLMDFAIAYADDTPEQKARSVGARDRYPVALDVTRAAQNRVMFTTPTGSRHLFTQARDVNADGVVDWVSATMPGWVIASRADALLDDWALMQTDGRIYEFDRAGRLCGVRQVVAGASPNNVRLCDVRLGKTTPEEAVNPSYQLDAALTIHRTQFPRAADRNDYIITDSSGRTIALQFDSFQHVTQAELRADDDRVLMCSRYEYENNAYLSRVNLYAGDCQTGVLVHEAAYRYTAPTTAEGGVEGARWLTMRDDARAPIAAAMHYQYDALGRVVAMDAAPLMPDPCTPSADVPDDERQPRPFRCLAYATDNGLQTTITDDLGRAAIWTYQASNDATTAYRLLALQRPGEAVPLEFTYEEVLPTIIAQENPDSLRNNIVLGWDTAAGLLTSLVQNIGQDQNRRVDYSATYDTLPVPLGNGTYPLARLVSYQLGDGVAAHQVEYPTPDRLVLREPSGLETTFTLDAEGAIARVAIGNEETRFDYHETGYVRQRDDASGVHDFVWDDVGRLTQYTIRDTSDEVVADYTIAYAYDEATNLCEAITDTLTDTTTTYCRDARDRLVHTWVAHRDEPTIFEQTSYVYDGYDRLIEVVRHLAAYERGQALDVACQVPDACARTTYTYAAGAADGEQSLTVTQPNGLSKTYVLDAQDRLLRMVDERGGEIAFEHDLTPEQLGAADSTLLDSAPLFTRITASNGAETLLGYSWRGQLCRLIYDQEIAWTLDYNLDYVRTQAINATDCDLNLQSRPTRLILDNSLLDRLGNNPVEVIYQFDEASGRLASLDFTLSLPSASALVESPQSIRLAYTYGEQGRLTRLTNGFTGGDDPIEYAVDAETGLQTITTTHTGEAVRLSYDMLGRLRRVQNEATGTISYEYAQSPDSGYQQVDVTFSTPDGTEERWRLYYDALGNLRQWDDEQGIRTFYAYDLLSRLIEVTREDPASDTTAPIMRYAYDIMGNLLHVQRYDGRDQQYTYDTQGQLIVLRDFDGLVTTYHHDAQGQIISVTDGLGASTRYTYDNRGRITAITNPTGYQTWYDWSALAQGQLCASDGPDCAEPNNTIYAFDWLNRLRGITDAQGNAHVYQYEGNAQLSGVQLWQADGRAGVDLGMGFNARGQLVSLGDWTWTYDALGNITQRDDGTTALDLTYDRLGRVRDIVGSGGTILRRYLYQDEARFVERQGNNEFFEYQYDGLGRLLAITDTSVGARELQRFVYDTTADPLEYTEVTAGGFERRVELAATLGTQVPFITECFIYVESPDSDAAERTTYAARFYTLNERRDLVGITDYAYFTEALPCGQVDASPEKLLNLQDTLRRDAHIAYDAMGRPTRYTNADGQVIAYSYDARGNLSAVQYPDGRTYTYTNYDNLNRPQALILPDHRRVVITYDDPRIDLAPIAQATTEAVSSIDPPVMTVRDAFQHPLAYAIADMDTVLEVTRPFLTTSSLEDRLETQYTWDVTAQVVTNRSGVVDRLRYSDDNGLNHDYRYTYDFAAIPQVIEETINVRRTQTRRAYDVFQRPTAETIVRYDPRNPTQPEQIIHSLLINYDDAGRRTQEIHIDPAGNTSDYRYEYRADSLLKCRVASQAASAACPPQTASLPMRGSLTLLSLPGVVLLAVFGLRSHRSRRALFSLPCVLALLMMGMVNAQEDEITRIEYQYTDEIVTQITVNGVEIPLLWEGAQLIGVGSEVFSYTEDRLTAWNETIYDYVAGDLVRITNETDVWTVVPLSGALAAVVASDGDLVLYDGQGVLRQQGDQQFRIAQDGRIIIEHDGDGNAITTAPNTVLPVFDGMIYVYLEDVRYGLYLTLSGRPYDPQTGHYLSPDATLPDTVVDPYTYRLRNEVPPNQIRSESPYFDALALLAASQQIAQAVSHADVLQSHLPSLAPRWEDERLARLQQYNHFIGTPYTDIFASTYALMNQINDPGVVVGADGGLQFFSSMTPGRAENHTAAPPHDLPALDVLSAPATRRVTDDMHALANPYPVWPGWYRAQAWWAAGRVDQKAYAVSPPQMDNPLLATQFYPYPLRDLSIYTTPIGTSGTLPIQPTDAWLDRIDEQMLPQPPEIPPPDAEGWLTNWFVPFTESAP